MERVEVRSAVYTDRHRVRVVNERAFGRPDEADLVDALRAGGHCRIELVAERQGHVVGHILFSGLTVERAGESILAKVLSLAPLSVTPEFQRKGIGSALVEGGLKVARERGESLVVVLGHPDFYPRFGFSAELAQRLSAPFSGPAFMAFDLTDGGLRGLTGEVRYPPPFGIT